MLYTKEIVELREVIRITKDAQEADLELIGQQGSAARLARYKEETGVEPTAMMVSLAKMNDDLEIALLSIHHKIAEGNSNDVVSAVNNAAPKFLELPLAAKAYIAERTIELSEMATSIKV